ncbi:hypothetical protein BSPWISOXPB_9947 [uncultured Gammaproteobacteria bacterium]|nr:hypothetical protein BSPWISOXPB_9947 [uncultured Gammaproteobacteria bacterium]
MKKNLANYLGVFYESYKVVYCKYAIVIIIQTFAALSITTASNFSTPENTAKVIDLTADVTVSGSNSLDFAILSGADANKFTLKGNKLTFEATDFEARSDVAYRVKVQATFIARFYRGHHIHRDS